MSIEGMAARFGMIKDTITSGGFFGEKALFENKKRNATIMSNVVTELLVIQKHDFSFVS
jgi:hypothetical protein